MNLHFNRVATIVDEEDDWVQLIPDHSGNILHSSMSNVLITWQFQTASLTMWP